jgi:hypothetical protein
LTKIGPKEAQRRAARETAAQRKVAKPVSVTPRKLDAPVGPQPFDAAAVLERIRATRRERMKRYRLGLKARKKAAAGKP